MVQVLCAPASDGAFSEHAELPRELPIDKVKEKTAKPRAPTREPPAQKVDDKATREAALAFERERQRRERECRKCPGASAVDEDGAAICRAALVLTCQAPALRVTSVAPAFERQAKRLGVLFHDGEGRPKQLGRAVRRPQAEREFSHVLLVEGEELSSNPLQLVFQ